MRRRPKWGLRSPVGVNVSEDGRAHYPPACACPMSAAEAGLCGPRGCPSRPVRILFGTPRRDSPIVG